MDLHELLRAQDGAVHRSQALDMGMSIEAIKSNLRRSWRRTLPCVYLVPKYLGPLAREHAAALYGGRDSALCLHTAAWMWGLIPERPDVVHLLVHHDRHIRPQAGLHAHRCAGFDRTLMEPHSSGLLLVSRERTVFDLCGYLRGESERVALVASVLKDRRCSQRQLELEAARDRFSPGGPPLGRIVESLQPGYESVIEMSIGRRCCRSGLPEPQSQYLFAMDTGSVARLDLAWPAYRVALLVHGRRFHLEAETWERDQDVESALAAAGWLAVTATGRAILSDGDLVVRRVKAALQQHGWTP